MGWLLEVWVLAWVARWHSQAAAAKRAPAMARQVPG